MGIYISLSIMPNHIDSDRWNTVYLQTLQLLRAWPEPLLSIQARYVGDKRVGCLCRNLELVEGDRRYWKVDGDSDSLHLAESFTLPFSLDAFEDYRGDEPDILLCAAADHVQGAVTLFSSKSQGHPYHQAVLAAAMWVEHCFPGFAMVSGDINRGQCERAAETIADCLGEEVSMPVCVSPDRLLSRLSRYYVDDALLEAFVHLYRGGEERSYLAALLQHCDIDLVSRWLARKMSGYQHPDLMGVTDYCISWLNAEASPEQLLRVMCLYPEGPRFDPVDVVDPLVSTWVSVPIRAREAMNAFSRPDDQAQTVWSQFGGIFLDIGGFKGRAIRVFIPQETMCEAFARLFPEKALLMEEAYQKGVTAAVERLDQVREPFDALADQAHEEGALTDGMEFMYVDDPHQAPRRFQQYFDVMAMCVASFRRTLAHQDYGNSILDGDLVYMIRFIATITEKFNLVLTEDAWNYLENQTDTNLMFTACAMLARQSPDQIYENLRWAALEKPQLLAYISERSYEVELPAEDDDEDDEDDYDDTLYS